MPITSATNALATITSVTNTLPTITNGTNIYLQQQITTTDLSTVSISNLIAETTSITSLSDPALWITTFGAAATFASAIYMWRSVKEMKRQHTKQNRPKLSIFSKDIFVEKGEVEDDLTVEILNYSIVPTYNIMLDTEPKFYNNMYLPRILGPHTLSEFEWHKNSLHPQQKIVINIGRFEAVFEEGCVHGAIKEYKFIMTYFDSQGNKYEDNVLFELPIDNYEKEYLKQQRRLEQEIIKIENS